MRDIVVSCGSAVRLPAGLAAVTLGLLAVADPAVAQRPPRPAAPVQARGHTKRTPVLRRGRALLGTASTPGRAALQPGPAGRLSPEALLSLRLLADANVLSPRPRVKVCADAAVGAVKVGVHLILGPGACLPNPPVAIASPVVKPPPPIVVKPVKPAPVPQPAAAAPAPQPVAPAAHPLAPVPRPAAAARPANPGPANPRSVSPPGASTAPSHARRVPPPAAEVLPEPHRPLKKSVLVMVIVAIVIAAVSGGLFAGLR